MSAILINENNFETEVANSDIPVLLDFYTPYCGPCRMLSPVLDKLANEFSGQVKVVKIDGAENIDLSRKYNIGKVPALVAIKEGVEVDRQIGFIPEPKIREWLDKIGLVSK